ncbi:MAG TPA: 5'-3' exonuclease [Jiangellaceae bacterium]|nr:5'-3' exonuclease [Jiangellaceae bacterium]
MTDSAFVGRLLLLDTASLYFRAFYGVPESMRAPDGTPVNAVRGLLDFIGRLVSDLSPERMVACMDADWRPAFRVEALPSYKAHRLADDDGTEDVPDALEVQVPIIVDVLAALGIATVGVPGFEADDVIGTLATADPGPVDIVTGDRDLFQLVDDSREVRILYTARGVGKHDVIDEDAVLERYGIPGRAYADFATLRGDPSDGLPGVKGIGDKTAASLITRYSDLRGVVAAAADPTSDLSTTMRRRITEAADYLTVAPSVVLVRPDVPLPEFDPSIPVTPRDPDALNALDERWGLAGSLRRAVEALRELAGRP